MITQADLARYPDGPVAPGGAIDTLMDKYPNLHGDLSAGSGAGAISRDPEFGRAVSDSPRRSVDVRHRLPVAESKSAAARVVPLDRSAGRRASQDFSRQRPQAAGFESELQTSQLRIMQKSSQIAGPIVCHWLCQWEALQAGLHWQSQCHTLVDLLRLRADTSPLRSRPQRPRVGRPARPARKSRRRNRCGWPVTGPAIIRLPVF